VQVMIERAGAHFPLDKIKEARWTKEMEWCHEAPFYTLGGPLVTDIAAGIRPHYEARFGAAMIGWAWRVDAVLRERRRSILGLPNPEDVEAGA